MIGVGIHVTGNIEASVDLEIRGKVSGDVRCATLLLGQGSEVRGNVVARRVRAAGLVEGTIDTGDLAVEATARIVGDLTYARIRIANGAVVHGQMQHRAAEAGAGDEDDRLMAEPQPLRRTAQAGGQPATQPKAVYIE